MIRNPAFVELKGQYVGAISDDRKLEFEGTVIDYVDEPVVIIRKADGTHVTWPASKLWVLSPWCTAKENITGVKCWKRTPHELPHEGTNDGSHGETGYRLLVRWPLPLKEE